MQPLDVAKGLRATTLSKYSFPRLLLELQNKLEQENKGSTNIIPSLYPVDQIKRDIPRTVQEDENISRNVSDVVIDILSNLCKYAALTATPRQRRKRLQIPPGKSVSVQDSQEPSTSDRVNISNKFVRTAQIFSVHPVLR